MPGLILLYHRVAELTSDPQLLAVTPSHFAQHLEVLRNYGTPMSLAQMIATSRDRNRPSRAIAVTFDDGYADAFECAAPLLARVDIPATAFVTTSYVGGAREFWWDDLERLLLLPGRLPETLRLRVGERVHEWPLDDAAIYDEHAARRDGAWTVECPGDPSPRHRAYRALGRLLRVVTGAERDVALDELARLANAPAVGRSTHRPLSREQLARLCEARGMDIGAHTTTHSALSALSEEEQRSEIVNSKAVLRELTGQEPAGFSYPFGGRADYTRRTVALVRGAGFAFGCANIPGIVSPASDPFQLPRVLVRDWDGDTFATKLREWIGD